MMMEPKCAVAWLITCWPHESPQSKSLVIDVKNQKISQLHSKWFFNVVLNLSELEICIYMHAFVYKLFPGFVIPLEVLCTM